MSSCIVLGGSGFIGRRVCQHLVQNGFKVKSISRHPFKTQNDSIQFHPMDLSKPSAKNIANLLDKNVKGIINLIGIMYEDKSRGITFQRLHEELPKELSVVAKENDLHLVHVSAIGANSNSDIPYLRSKGHGERYCSDSGCKYTILRPSLVFGPEDTFFNRFAMLLNFLPVLPVFNGGKSLFQPAYVDDIAEAIVKIVGNANEYNGKIFELAGPDVLTYRQMMEKIVAYTGKTRPIVSMPNSIANLQAFFMEMLPVNPLTITRDQIKMLGMNNVASENMPGFKELKITPKYIDEIVPQYLNK
ncbi:NAD(P)-binding domain-containing protein [Rozella allomycis CSF55]|uniref:NAD(P)-binding domain-containing protein n=1 Tax=Rozella allomycis (strain CSF55) TaxID=988480 RepID=A0A075AVM9_ROZAC|nr:NAD(P)-binding domain-containing protein [Rozella allomycis CSF55]|eukprot:EPZ34383.1 NAD(P)-binding domain-containing protein [Rozella allomycis CSF55]